MIREFHQIDLSGRNSFGVGQQAARLAEFETEEDLRTIFSGGVPERWAVLSGGNNILFTRDYDGLLLTPVARQITPLGEEGDTVRVRADAGVEWDDLVEWAVERGLWGIENLSLIPGKAGAAPVQNIGAYGCEAKDVIERVHMFCTDNRSAMVIDAGHCCFGYRESIFKHELRGRVIITAVDIRLSHTPRPRLGYGDVEREVEARGGVTLRNIREAICAIRRAKLPDPKVTGNAGSFFKNPVVDECVARQLQAQWPDMPVYPAAGCAGRVKLAAGWLIDKAGLKGYKCGRVGVHERQALVLVNLGGIVACAGAPDGRDFWRVAVQSPFSASDSLGILRVKDESVVTSAVYQRFFEWDGLRYHHLIDPETLMPGNFYSSVTVVCKDPAAADLLSTRLFLLPIEESRAAAESAGADALWVLPNGETLMTDGFRRRLEE